MVPGLHDAARAGNLSEIERLISCGANINAQNSEKDTALIIAAKHGHIDIVERLLQVRAKVHLQNDLGNSALNMAAFYGHETVLERLLQACAPINLANQDGYTALISAANDGHCALVEKLLKAGARVNFANKKGNTSLILASNNGHSAVVQQLLQAGANIGHSNEDEDTPLMCAAANGHSMVVKQLLQVGSHIDHCSEVGVTALICAAFYGHSAVVQQLLQAGANVDHADEDGDTALILAALNGHSAVVQQLLQAGANVDHANKYGCTALTYAAKNGHSAVVQQLLQAGATIDHADEDGDTALILAASCGHTEVVQQLLHVGAYIAHANKDGNSALHSAVNNGFCTIVDELLQYGASVDLRDVNGCTPLLCAVRNGHTDIARRLFDAGADPRATNNADECALSLLPRDSELCTKFRLAQSRFRPCNALEKLWVTHPCLEPQKKDMLTALKSVYIDSFSSFIMAHNLLLLAVRQRVIRWDEIRQFGGNRDYLLENLYLPVTKLDLSQEQKFLVARILSYAEKKGLIRDGHAALVKAVADLRSEIRESKMEIQTALVTVARKINGIDQRLSALERWTKQATDEFQKVCGGQQQMLNDMKRMSTCLNELHTLLRKQERNRKIAGVLGFCLSMIPVVGGAMAGATFATNELASGLNWEHALELGSSGISAVLSVDLSSFQSIGALTSKEFLSKLDPVAQRRVETVVKHSQFQTVACLQNEVESMITDSEMYDMEPIM